TARLRSQRSARKAQAPPTFEPASDCPLEPLCCDAGACPGLARPADDARWGDRDRLCANRPAAVRVRPAGDRVLALPVRLAADRWSGLCARRSPWTALPAGAGRRFILRTRHRLLARLAGDDLRRQRHL